MGFKASKSSPLYIRVFSVLPSSHPNQNPRAMKKHVISFYFTLFFVFLSVPLLHWMCCSSSSSPDAVPFQGRRLLSTIQSIRVDKSQVVDEESQSLLQREGFADMDESVYHLDYHGVKTHPSPSPKNPSP